MEDQETMKMPDFDLDNKRIFVAGHRGMVGSAVVRALRARNCEVITAPWPGVDLRRQDDSERWLRENVPDAVILSAARVGGILANQNRPAEFIYDNLAIASSIVDVCRQIDVQKLLFLGSSCVYPRKTSQPITEDALLTGLPEPTNEWYAVAKIAGMKLCQAYRRQYGCNFVSAMPCNLYGPHDNFDLNNSHVIPAIMRKMHEANLAGTDEVVIWGTGTPRREFLHVDDLADALVHLLEWYSDEQHVNVGTGVDLTIADLAETLKDVTRFRGRLVFDQSKPDGVARKLLDVSRLSATGWRPKIELRDGLASVYEWFLEHRAASLA